MAFDTVGGYLRDARTILQDKVPPYRYTNIELVRAFNLTLMEARRIRPDLFVGYLDAVPQYDWVEALGVTNTDGDDAEAVQSGPSDNDDDDNPTWSEWVPMELQFRQAFVAGIVAHALSRDQEDIDDERATGFMKTFVNILTGVDVTKGKQPTKV